MFSRYFILFSLSVLLLGQTAVGEQGYGGGYGQQGGMGSYPFQGGNYGMGGGMMGGGMAGGGMAWGAGGGGSGSGSGAKYERNKDVDALKDAEYTKQISEASSASLEASAQATEKTVESIGKNQLEEAEVQESVVKAAQAVGTTLNTKDSDEIVKKYEVDVVNLGKTLTSTIEAQTRTTIQSMAAQSKPVQESPTLLQSISGAPGRVSTSPFGAMMQANPQGTASQPTAIADSPQADRTPASHDHGFAAKEASLLPPTQKSMDEGANSGATGLDRSMIHNLPSGY